MTYQTLAAVDLGSNSFKLQVARVQGDQLYPLDALKENVRLAAGLDKNKHLTAASQQQALACLRRFNERLRALPKGAVRCVGTSALRVAKNAEAFIEAAELTLGFPIEIIAGREEARLIYLGVAHSLPPSSKKRLVIDIGGGSTECITGLGARQLDRESLSMGCVNASLAYFPDGKIDKSALRAAEMDARLKAQAIESSFDPRHWDEAIGSSGTIRAIGDIIQANGWGDEINRYGLDQLRDALLKAGHIYKLSIDGLKPDRLPVLAGGFTILCGIFDAFGIQRMGVASGALREGLLYDLLGRMSDHDMREQTVAEFSQRYHVDTRQADYVSELALRIFNSLSIPQDDAADAQRFLTWAARLHEIGISIAHTGYHKHSAYILENADMPGFSRTDQTRLALLARAQRGSLNKALLSYTKALSDIEKLSIWVLRLAVLLCRNREKPTLSRISTEISASCYRLHLPHEWLANNPLSQRALEEESAAWAAAGFKVRYG